MKNEREDGRKEKIIEAARLMLQDGVAIEKIIRYTGLKQEEIEGIHDLSDAPLDAYYKFMLATHI